jgi:hypothetical protein
MNHQILQEIDGSISQHREAIEAGQSLQRLMVNRDFKRIVLDGYLAQEAVRLVHLKSDPQHQAPEVQTAIVSQIDAIGRLMRYLNGIRDQADIAKKDLSAAEQLRDQILSEDA